MLAAIATWLLRGPRSPQIAWGPKAPGVVSAPVLSAATIAESHRAWAAKPAGENRAAEVSVFQQQLPKLDVFPTPRTLTTQEQALVAFAAQVPPAVQLQVVEAEKHIGDPIVIAELTIRPLDEKDRE